jgi:hypothetical protein
VRYALEIILVVVAAVILWNTFIYPLLLGALLLWGVGKPKVIDPVPPEVRKKEEAAYKRAAEIQQEVKADQKEEEALDTAIGRLKQRQKERLK